MRHSTAYLIFAGGCGIILLLLLVLHPVMTSDAFQKRRAASRQIVRELYLTDLCLFTEARYTRNPSLADLHSAFQDHPMSLEHFPSGSLIRPPAWRY